MPGATITEKIVSRAMGKKTKAGDVLEELPVDKLYFNEVIAPPAILNFEKDFEDVFTESGKKMQVFNPSRIVVPMSPAETGVGLADSPDPGMSGRISMKSRDRSSMLRTQCIHEA